MGQQQLLLIVLGVIIVGIAVVVGINVFTASSAEANRDAIVSDLTNLAAMAQQYYRKPDALGGGGNSFTGWTVPTQLANTANMSEAVTYTTGDQSITLSAKGTESVGGSKVQATMTVYPDSVSTTINN